MTASIEELIGDEDVVALTYRQALESVEGRVAPVHPPTYPVPPGKGAPKDECRAEYTVNEIGDGVRICELDTVQSQANRMEASFRGELAGVIPRHAVEAGGHRADLTELPHRLADASIRATALAGDIRAAFDSFVGGDPAPLARLSPTSLVYGAWDSRDTRVAVRRALESPGDVQRRRVKIWLGAVVTASPSTTITRDLKIRHRLAALPLGCSAPSARYIL